MHSVLEHEHGISAEQAFGIYDMKDSGECSLDEFRRILRIFFGEVLPSDADLEVLEDLCCKQSSTALPTRRPGTQRVAYREFCKFLSKRAVRTFKSRGGAPDGAGADKSQLGADAMLQRELERPLRKEATLTYVLRKAAELHLDLRKILVEHDKNELNVIPRSKFVGILLDHPLGINEIDVQEILENELHFDNYGNVDYTVILNSDLFCVLERQRLKASHKKAKQARVTTDGEAAPAEQESSEVEKVDNRKVVVEDLIYIDDLEILIYTTIAPKTSSVFVTSAKKS